MKDSRLVGPENPNTVWIVQLCNSAETLYALDSRGNVYEYLPGYPDDSPGTWRSIPGPVPQGP